MVTLRKCGAMLRSRECATALFVACFAAVVASLIKCANITFEVLALQGPFLEIPTFNIFTAILGLFIMIHLAYVGWCHTVQWSLLHQMMADYLDAASILISLCTASTASPTQCLLQFQQIIIRLMSILFMVSIAELESQSADGQKNAFTYQLVDARGIDRATLLDIERAQFKVERVCHQLQNLVMKNRAMGTVILPASLQAQAFQSLRSGIVKLHEARSFKQAPLLLPCATLTRVLLCLHWIALPCVAAARSRGVLGAALACFLQTFILWILHGIAASLEGEAGCCLKAFDAAAIQRSLNARLLAMLYQAATPVPKLSHEVTCALNKIPHMSIPDMANLAATQSFQSVLAGFDKQSEYSGITKPEESDFKTNIWDPEMGPADAMPAAGSITKVQQGASRSLHSMPHKQHGAEVIHIHPGSVVDNTSVETRDRQATAASFDTETEALRADPRYVEVSRPVRNTPHLPWLRQPARAPQLPRSVTSTPSSSARASEGPNPLHEASFVESDNPGFLWLEDCALTAKLREAPFEHECTSTDDSGWQSTDASR